MRFQRNIFDYLKVWQLLWQSVWNLTDFLGIGLGRFAPWVFAQMTGATHWRKSNKPIQPTYKTPTQDREER